MNFRSFQPWLLATALLLSSIPLLGQMSPKGKPSTQAFPEISVSVHHRDPAERKESDFEVAEDEQAVPFELETLEPGDSTPPHSILVLLELLPQQKRKQQNKYFKEVLKRALPSLLRAGDQINVATFAWTDLENDEKVLSFLNADFGTDTSGLAQKVEAAEPPGGKGVSSDHGSELYPALLEGIGALEKVEGQARSLVVLSAEFPNIWNPKTELTLVTEKAKSADVAIYNFRYRIMKPKYNIDNLAKESYGLSYEVDPEDAEDAARELKNFMDRAPRRALGRDYQLSYTSTSPKDGQVHNIRVSSGGDRVPFAVDFPSLSLNERLRQNPLLFGGIGLGILLLLVLIFFLWWRSRKKRADSEAEQQKHLQEMEEKGREAEERLKAQGDELKSVREEQERKIQAEKEEREREEAEQEEARLMEEMFSNGKSPRLVLAESNKYGSIALPSPISVVGRDADADIQIDLNTVSRFHFQVIYQSDGFRIRDLGSTNGTRVNGERIEDAPLDHGDTVHAGGVSMTFFV